MFLAPGVDPAIRCSDRQPSTVGPPFPTSFMGSVTPICSLTTKLLKSVSDTFTHGNHSRLSVSVIS